MYRTTLVGGGVSALALVLSAGAAMATDPPVSLVSFQWTANGSATPSAGANCDVGCDNTSGCNTSVASYADSGAAMVEFFGQYHGYRTCYGVCGGLAIGVGVGQVDANVSIHVPFMDGPALRWQWSDTMGTQTEAAGGDAICGHSFATGQAATSQTWDTVFDVLAGDAGGSAPGAMVTLLTFGHAHWVDGNSPATGGNAASSWLLERVGGTVIESDSIQMGAQGVNHSSTSVLGLAAGRYHFHSTQSDLTTSAGGSPGNSAASAWTWRFEPYTCASIVTQPINATACNGQTTSVYFGVVAGGTGPVYEWQWRPTAAAAWRDVVAQDNFNDAGVRVFNAGGNGGAATYVGVQYPHGQGNPTPQFRCIVSNSCATVTSNPATLTICMADFNCAGGSTVNDIFDFLAAWFMGDPRADINGTGGNTVNDIFDFLAMWFAGCP